ncbi:TonB-dependent receptor family protein [Oxalicibacterium faecigallinarum]|uniref:TonB-dependent receptor n=1 Tax=Oxalicibacterium faecigallinarum TaxID=573741 RepID=A0A8J3AQ10_9BURK|nr:TonB-dependent receptor [Oxalicibacterium faecigallinarum]GGI18038.1 TonB-dependent receptor [Oxalicibacterium faecigallinarum]
MSPIDVKGETAERAAAREYARSILGNVSIRFTEDVKEHAAIGLADALASLPGVYVQRPSGQEAARVSMRGSGIASTGIRGIRLLRDGLPLGRLDDMNEAIYADIMSAHRIDVYRGASSLQYGASTLGGALNLISPTAYNDPGATARMEAGSDGFRRIQLKGGKVFESGLDVYVSASHYETDSFRENAAERSSRLYANIGYAFSATSRGRLHITEERYTGQLPGTLTLEQIRNTPWMAHPQNRAAGAYIHTSPRWHLAYQQEWDIGEDRLTAGVFHTGTKFDSPTQVARARYDATDYGLSLRHEINRLLNGHANRFVWGVNAGRGDGDNSLVVPAMPGVTAGGPGTIRDRRSNIEVFAQNTYQLNDRLSFIGGAQFAQARRSTDNSLAATLRPIITQYPDGSASRTYTSLNPSIGAIYDLGMEAQVYANLTRSHEAPASLAFFNGYPVAGFPPSVRTATLEQQRATTFEIGVRGGDRQFGWDIAVYRSRVNNELLAIANTLAPTLPTINVNSSSDTEHSGLELGLHGTKSLPLLSASMDWNFAYTWNHFRFDGHPNYGNNRLPGIPDHVLQAGFTYRHTNGFYIGPRIELGSSWYADQANSLKAPGYGVLHLQTGYVARGGYRFFIDARNLGDKHYAVTADHMVDARVAGTSSAVFRPGQVKAIFAGIEKRW